MYRINYLTICFLLITSYAKAQAPLNEFLLYHNKNAKVDYYYLIDEDYRIVFSNQVGSNPLSIRLMSNENLILDTLKYKLHPEGFHKVCDRKLMISGNNESVLVEIVDGRFSYENEVFVDEAKQGTNRSVILNNNTFSWETKRQGKHYINEQLLINFDKTLIDRIPKRYKNSSSNPTSKQRVLDVKQWVSKDYLKIFIFKAQQIYVVDTKNMKVNYFDLPEYENSVWYFFHDVIKDRDYLIKETNEGVLKLYAFYGSEGIRSLKEIDQFPENIADNKLIFKKVIDEGTYYYGIPINDYKSFKEAEAITPLHEIDVQVGTSDKK